MHLAIDRVGRYILRREIARGSSASVYEGWDPNFERTLAVKLVPLPGAQTAEATEALERFRQGARAAAKLSHPNIVMVYDYGENGDYAYLVMEYIEGPTLKSVFEKEREFDLADIRAIVGSILDALQYSHDHGVVHRDIKPDNILFTRDGQVKITDFGIARLENSEMTQAGMVLGSPAYMSPEQFVGERTDARTDIYSTGIVLYEMLTGERAYMGSITTIMHNKLYGPLPSPSRSPGLLTPPLERLVSRAIARDRDVRFASAAEFRGAMLAAISLSQAPSDAPPAKPAAELRAARESRVVPARTGGVGRTLVVGASALTVLLAAGATIWHFNGLAPSPASVALAPHEPTPPAPAPLTQAAQAQAPLAQAPLAQAPPPQPMEAAPQSYEPPAPPVEPQPPRDTTPAQTTEADLVQTLPAEPSPPPPMAAQAVPVAPLPPVAAPPAPSRPLAPARAPRIPPQAPPQVAPPQTTTLAETNSLAAALRRLRQEKPKSEPPPSPPAQDLDAAYPVVSSSGVGLLCSSITPDTAGNFGLDGPRGMVITGVVVGSPAAKAGLRQNDVILKIDGQDTRTLTVLTKIASSAAPGQTVPIEILRHGAPQIVQLNVDTLRH